jgi:release factor glutamine methyltransferase
MGSSRCSYARDSKTHYMTTQDWLTKNTQQLQLAEIATARLDCLVLLEDETGKDRGWLLAHPEYDLQIEKFEKLSIKIVQRTQNIPLAYIRGKVEFYCREFLVNEHVLVPRPETENMIELLKTLDLSADSRIADIGTGSGCIVITAALELPSAIVQAYDIDPQCLELATANATKLGAKVTFIQSNLLENVITTDVLLTNLPYVPNDYTINTAATYEPKLALFGGEDGLDLFRTMFEQIKSNRWKPSYVLTESLPEQHQTLAAIARKTAGYSLEKTAGFIQLFTN